MFVLEQGGSAHTGTCSLAPVISPLLQLLLQNNSQASCLLLLKPLSTPHYVVMSSLSTKNQGMLFPCFRLATGVCSLFVFVFARNLETLSFFYVPSTHITYIHIHMHRHARMHPRTSIFFQLSISLTSHPTILPDYIFHIRCILNPTSRLGPFRFHT